MLRKIATMAAVTFGLSAGAASAGTVYAQAATAYKAGSVPTTCAIDGSGDIVFEVNSIRSNICNALGEEDQKGDGKDYGFVSVGNFDALKFTFGGDFDGPIDLFEITFNRDTGWNESLDLVFLISGGGGASFGKAVKNGAPDAVADEGNKDRWIISFDTDLGPFSELQGNRVWN